MAINEHKYHIDCGTKKDFSLFGAFPAVGSIKFELHALRSDGLCSAVLRIHSDGLGEGGEKFLSFTLESECFGLTDIYSVYVDMDELLALSSGGLFYYRYDVNCFDGRLSLAGELATRLEPCDTAGERQLLLYAPDFRTPEFLRQGTIYHVFVDRFFSSGKCDLKEGTVKNSDWDGGVPQYNEYRGAPLKNNEFFGGDLWGVADKLDHIKELGADTIYLSPIFDAASNHKYDTGDYMKVDSMFGGDEALEALIKKCRENGMHVILDGVFNHTGADSVYFNKFGSYDSVGAYNSELSPYYDWYNFFEFPDKYECWWGIDILPRVKSDSEGFRRLILGRGGVIEKYMGMGVSGFRLDVADELSDDFLCEMRRVVRKKDSDSVLIGEVWEDASCKIAYGNRRSYFSGFELDSVMNYPLRQAVISFINHGDAEGLRRVTETVYRHYPKCVSDVLMNFLGTHDTERILTVLGDVEMEERSNAEYAVMKLSSEELAQAVLKLKCAYTIIAFMYGVPSIFYGDEAGLEGYHDPFCRRPYPWNSQNTELLEFFRSVGKVRRREAVLREGLFRVVLAEPDVFIFERFGEGEKIVVAVTRNSSYELRCDSPVRCILSSCKKKLSKKNLTSVTLPSFSAHVFKGRI